ncbi:hypothetical protein [Sediminicola sp. YIK13]|uniref:hypothetical protein n=1 Tax=Sediminicola sp. YIK13 TaxID=1453352 RepID=UPI0011AA39F0|nr:hypothetical protein [Sediminicola sp. YIK13]
MRIALCYHGIAKGENFKDGGLEVGYRQEFDLIKRNLIEHNPNCKFDIFLHSWSYEFQEEIVSYMKPKGYSFEVSKDIKNVSFYTLIKESVKKLIGKTFEYKRMNNIYSRWYSFQKACNLVKQSGINYDLIIITRFDMALLSPFDVFQLDSSSFYSGDWLGLRFKNRTLEGFEYKEFNNKEGVSQIKIGYPYDKEGLQDFFFIGSSEYMLNSFGNIFDELPSLLKKYGHSNHYIALGKLKEDDIVNKHQRILTYGKDYFLTRWL